jgi:hypothetical protein
MAKHRRSVDSMVLQHIKKNGRGYVFTAAEFLHLGSLNAVGLTLRRAARQGAIRKLARGLYDYPGRDSRLGLLAPSIDAVARALAGRDSSRLQPAGAQAANVLGLSEQVPVRAVFLTDGRARTVRIGRQQVILKHTTPRQMASAGRVSGTVIQALRWLGRPHVDDRVVAALRGRLSDRDKKQLRADLRHAPAWVADVIRRVAEPRG